MALVVDASMALAWYFPQEATSPTRAAYDRTNIDAIVVPRHWFAEVANGMLVGERRKRSILSQSSKFILWLGTRMIEIDDVSEQTVFTLTLKLARAHGLTVYDAIYLELAERRGLPLATLDKALAAAARRVGVEVVGSGD